mmetsp:Transcript_64909/g.180643  ORF Transcript_64909/g.180643 Transcript_64909/m.180643 type:complete len:439 (+) Transcript_64909:57-1373(+)
MPRAGAQPAAEGRVVARGEYLELLARARRQPPPAQRSAAAPVAFAGEAGMGIGPGGLAVQHCAYVPTNAPGAGGAAGFGGGAPKNRQVRDNFVNRVVGRCGPAVVRVETEQKVEMSGVENADLFSFFFGGRPDARRRERRLRGHGSGFCIDGNTGMILTNAHVVQGADRVCASFAGHGAPLECEVLETDEVIDLACIRLKDRPKATLPAMTLGSSESVMTGDWAVVLGNPFGLQNTCTLGIVSSLDRSTGETGFDWMRHPLLQTDAAVNQGNSGGPMLNELGEVIGMISMRALFGEGIGFAIPADSIRAALPSLMQRTKVPRAYIGLKMSADAPNSDSRNGRGAFVEMVLPRSPAEAAGFEVEDEIVEANGRKVRHFDEVQSLIRSANVGTKLTFRVKRRGDSRSLTVEAADIRRLKEQSEARGREAPHGGSRVIVIP